MKKIIPFVAIAAGAAALVAYKLKKEEQKQIVDLDQGLLEDEDDMMGYDEEVEEAPISNPAGCVEDEEEDEAPGFAQQAKNLCDCAKEAVEEVQETVKEAYEDNKEDMDETFPALLKTEVSALKEKASDIIAKMTNEGDVHENERPIQHAIHFTTPQDRDNFKNEVINRGYVITRGEDELDLSVLHIAPIDEEKLLSHVLFLANAAKAHHGEYQGWNSKIIY